MERNWRLRGWIALVIGLFLMGAMAAIAWLTMDIFDNALARPGGARFRGTPAQAASIRWLFGLIFGFGLLSFVNGIYMVATRRQHKAFQILMVAMVAAIVVAGWLMTQQLGGLERP